MKASEFIEKIVEAGCSPLLARAYLAFAKNYGIPLFNMHNMLFPLLICVDRPKMIETNKMAETVFIKLKNKMRQTESEV